MKLVLEVDGERFEVEVQRSGEGLRIECEEAKLDLKPHVNAQGAVLESGKERWHVDVETDRNATVAGRRLTYLVSEFTPGSPVASGAAQARVPVKAVMHGRLVKVLTSAGQSVKKGDALFILEAMKMQNELASPSDGIVAEIVTKPGDVVDVGRVLAWLERRKE